MPPERRDLPRPRRREPGSAATPPPAEPACTVQVHHRRPADGPRTLLLHGLANSTSVWDALAAADTTGLDLWTAELPWGAGQPGGWAHQPDATWAVADALDQVPGGAQAVVAHSFSALLLLDLLSGELVSGRNPFARYGIEHLVLASPFYRRDPESFEYGVVAELLDNFRATMDEGIRVMAGPRLDAGTRHAMAQHVCERVGPYGYLSFFRSYLRTPWLRTDLITVPTLVISGDADVIAHATESTALTADLPNARCRFVAGAGHFPMVEQVDAFRAALGEFLGPADRAGKAVVDEPARSDRTGARTR